MRGGGGGVSGPDHTHLYPPGCLLSRGGDAAAESASAGLLAAGFRLPFALCGLVDVAPSAAAAEVPASDMPEGDPLRQAVQALEQERTDQSCKPLFRLQTAVCKAGPVIRITAE